MYRYLLLAVLVISSITVLFFLLKPAHHYSHDETTQVHGQQIFAKYCSSCHGLSEDGFGPPLGGITAILSREYLISFIKNPGKAMEAGDARAVNLQSRYQQVMPSFEWMSDKDLHALLSYVDSQSAIHHLSAASIETGSIVEGLTGRLVPAVQKSALHIGLEELIQIPQIAGSSPDLGIVTLRPHPFADGRLFVSDQDGVIYSIKQGQAQVFLDLRKEIEDFQSGPGIATGIASFDFHPDFVQNGLIYILSAETYHGQIADYSVGDTTLAEVQWILSEWKMSRVSDEMFSGTHRELLRLHAPTFGHGAQDLRFNQELKKSDPDFGLLYFGYGDGGSNNIGQPELGHHIQSFLGTIMRIDPLGKNSKNGNYGIPADNPFVNESDPATVKEIYAFGFRNPHRFTWDSARGQRMIATDIGESNIEEINIIEKGGDYGWPRREGNYGILTTKDRKTVYRVPESDHQLYRKPFAQYDHLDGFAISGGFVYNGAIAPLKNKYIFGDIVSGKLFYTNMDSVLSDSAIYELQVLANGLQTDLQKMSGAKRLHLRIGYDQYLKDLYIITKTDGKVYKVVSASEMTG